MACVQLFQLSMRIHTHLNVTDEADICSAQFASFLVVICCQKLYKSVIKWLVLLMLETPHKFNYFYLLIV